MFQQTGNMHGVTFSVVIVVLRQEIVGNSSSSQNPLKFIT